MLAEDFRLRTNRLIPVSSLPLFVLFGRKKHRNTILFFLNVECGGVFTMARGRIHSLNYPTNYEANTNCEWLLRTEASHSLEFKFKDFDLEDQNCTADFVSIYDGPEKRDDKLLLRTCGAQTIGNDSTNQTRPGFTKPLRSKSNEMLVVMETDSDIQAKGFDAEYSTVFRIDIYLQTRQLKTARSYIC